MRAPVLLPSLALLSSVAVADPHFWPTVFSPGESGTWPDLTHLLKVILALILGGIQNLH